MLDLVSLLTFLLLWIFLLSLHSHLKTQNSSQIKSVQWKCVICSFSPINGKNMYHIYGWKGCLNLKRFTDEAFFNDTLYFEVIAACFLTWQLRAEGKQLHFVTGLICHIALQRLINLWLLIKLRFKCHCWRAGTW